MSKTKDKKKSVLLGASSTDDEYVILPIGADQHIRHGSAATEPTTKPEIPGFTPGTTWDKPFNNITADTEVYCDYVINTYTVKFVDYDGTTVIAERTVEHGTLLETVQKPDDPTREGYKFTGWSAPYPPESINSDNQVIGNCVITAQYKQVYSVIGIPNPENGGTVTGGGTEFKPGDAYTLTAVPNTNWKFIEWDDRDVSNIKTGSADKDLEFTANFTESTNHVVRYYLHRSATTPIILDTATQKTFEVVADGGKCTPPTPTLDGWTFDHWTDGIDGTTFKPSTKTVTKDLSLYAVWKKSLGAMNLGHSRTYDTTTRTDIVYSKNYECAIPNGTKLKWERLQDNNVILTHGSTLGNHTMMIRLYTVNATGDRTSIDFCSIISPTGQSDWHTNIPYYSSEKSLYPVSGDYVAVCGSFSINRGDPQCDGCLDACNCYVYVVFYLS